MSDTAWTQIGTIVVLALHIINDYLTRKQNLADRAEKTRDLSAQIQDLKPKL